MKELNRNEVQQVAGGLDPKQSDTQVASEPSPELGPIIDYNPEHPPQ